MFKVVVAIPKEIKLNIEKVSKLCTLLKLSVSSYLSLR